MWCWKFSITLRRAPTSSRRASAERRSGSATLRPTRGCVYAGSHAPRRATARVLDQQEADRALAAYLSRHRKAWDKMRPVLEETLGVPITETDTPLPLVELRLD